MSGARDFGRFYEDFEVGDVYKHWPGKTITEYDDHLFCMITMNHHPLHTNAHYAETQTHFKRNVVVGNLVNSLDLIIIASFGLALWNGYRRGALLQVFSWGGLAAGMLIGLALAPEVVKLFNVSATNSLRPVYTVIALLGISFVIEGVIASF